MAKQSGESRLLRSNIVGPSLAVLILLGISVADGTIPVIDSIEGKSKRAFDNVGVICPSKSVLKIIGFSQPDNHQAYNLSSPTVEVRCEDQTHTWQEPIAMKELPTNDLNPSRPRSMQLVSVEYDYTGGGLNGQSPELKIFPQEGDITLSGIRSVTAMLVAH